MPRGVYNRKPATAKKPVEPAEVDLTQGEDITLPPDGPVPERPSVIERTADIHDIDQKAEALKFNEERLTIMIHESSDPNAEKIVTLGVNGRMCYLERGVNYSITRKYVERLARAKINGVKTVTGRDLAGNETTKIVQTSALAFPFSVIEDPNPKGASWLRNLLEQA